MRLPNPDNLLILNNYSYGLLCASTALQTSLKHIFFEEMLKDISPLSESFNLLINPAEIIFGNPQENPIAINVIVIETTTSDCLWANPVC